MIIHVKDDQLHIDLPSLQNDLNQIGVNAINGFIQQGGQVPTQQSIENPTSINIHGDVYELEDKDLSIIQWLMQYKNISPTGYYDHMQEIFNTIFDQTSKILQAKDRVENDQKSMFIDKDKSIKEAQTEKILKEINAE